MMGNRKKETKPQQPQWYQLTAEEVFRTLGTGQEGLSANDVEERLLNYDYNELDIKNPAF